MRLSTKWVSVNICLSSSFFNSLQHVFIDKFTLIIAFIQEVGKNIGM